LDRGELTASYSLDGTEWLDALLDLGTEVTSEPSVQRTIMEKSKDQKLVLRMLGDQPSVSRTPDVCSPLVSSYELVPQPAAGVITPVSEAPSPTYSEIVSIENAELKADNAVLRSKLQALGQSNPRPAVARVQAATRGHLTRIGFYDDATTAARLAPAPASVAVRLVPVPSDVDGVRRVSLTMNVVPPCRALRRPQRTDAAAPRRPAELKTNIKLPNGVVISVGVVVGLLALVMMRNPQAARTAAAGAAAMVVALAQRAKQRSAC